MSLSQKDIKRCEELRQELLKTGASREGMARILALILFRAEGLEKEREESFQFFYVMSNDTMGVIKGISETCLETGEVEVHGLH